MYRIVTLVAISLALTGCGIPFIDLDIPIIPGI
jgi:hypothetical protein